MNFLTTLLEQYYLMEKLEDVIKNNPLIDEHIIRGYHANALPDGNKSDKLLNHVLKLHRAGEITPDRAHELKPHLTALHLSNQLNRIQTLKTLDDHKNATVGMNTITKKERVDVNTPVVYEDNNIVVKQHLNHESAIKGARLHPKNPMYKKTSEHGKAQWCVSLDNENGKHHFNYYTENGNDPMYTIHNKDTKRLTAFIANPNAGEHDLEIRDEQDKQLRPYQVLVDNKGLINTKVGDFVKEHYPDHVPVAYALLKARESAKHIKTLSQLNDAINGNNTYLKSELLNHPLLNEHHITKILNDHYPSPEHIISPLTDNLDNLVNHPLLNEHHITKILDANKDRMHKLVGDVELMGDVEVTNLEHLINHPKFNDNHRLQIINMPESKDKYDNALVAAKNFVLGHKSTDSAFITKMLDKHIPSNGGVLEGMMIADNPNVNEGHITQALASKSPYLRKFAIMHKYANEDQIMDTLKNDPDYLVRSEAIQHNKANLDHVNIAMQDPNESVRAHALHNRHANLDHIKSGLKDPSGTVRGYALSSPLITKELAAPFINDPSPFAAEKARDVMGVPKV